MNQLRDHLLSRRTIPAAFLGAPGPGSDEIRTILQMSARVPDHGKLAPWRFIVYRSEDAVRIGERLVELWQAKDPSASDERLQQERERFSRAPQVIGVVSAPQTPHKIPVWEQELSAGAVCMTMLHAARAMGFSAQWLSEWFSFDDTAAAFLGCRADERFAGFIHIGTPTQDPVERPRPDLDAITTFWKD